MAYDYALVHLKFTIPLAVLLTTAAYPILNRIHFYQIAALIVIAFTATLPWDAHLIKTGVWTYPSEVIVGLKWMGIPFEELFFFIIQTYITSVIYILFNQPLLHAQYLRSQRNTPRWITLTKLGGQLILAGMSALGGYMAFVVAGELTYLGLILVWACPFALITWTMAGKFIISLPWACTVLPVLIPTTYLWLVDELALGRGTWSIETGTKLGQCLFGVLEIEEATFFLVTNMLIVFGMATFDQYLAVIYAFPHIFPEVPNVPTPLLLLQGRFTGSSQYDMERIEGIQEAVGRLKKKSRSFYFASSVFTGRLRIDLVLLYSFCRMADDLIDDATSHEEMMTWVSKLYRFLDFFYDRDLKTSKTVRRENVNLTELDTFIKTEFPPSAKAALELLPTDILPGHPLYLLIDGFKMDAQFKTEKNTSDRFPIKAESDLIKYSLCVAGTIGELCVSLIVHHCGSACTPTELDDMLDASRQMGIALQYVNIARDIQVDAKLERVYLPITWLKEVDLTPEMIIHDPLRPEAFIFRERLLDEAFRLWNYARPVMSGLPDGGRGPMVVAVENYMEIGRVLRSNPGRIRTVGKATVPVSRRMWVSIKALMSA